MHVIVDQVLHVLLFATPLCGLAVLCRVVAQLLERQLAVFE